MEGLVTIHESLNLVFARWNVSDAGKWIAEDVAVDDRCFARFPILHIDAEDQLCVEAVGDLKTRFATRIVGDHQQQTPVYGLWGKAVGKGDTETELNSLVGRTS